jgi:hypothetical protein
MRGRSLVVALVVALLFTATACAPVPIAVTSSADAEPASETPLGEPLAFQATSVLGQPVASEALLGRTTIMAFVTTYDGACHAQLRAVDELLRSHTPRLNAVVFVLEPPENFPLVEAYASAARAPYPFVQLDPSSLPVGELGRWKEVPSVLLVDAEGRPRKRFRGYASAQVLERALQPFERTVRSVR